MHRDLSRHRHLARAATAAGLVGLALLVAPPGGAHDVPGVTVPAVPTTVAVPGAAGAMTAPGVTVPPVTVPVPPVTLAPVTLPPVTLPPVTLPTVTLPTVTLPTVTLPPVTLPGEPLQAAPSEPAPAPGPGGAGAGSTATTPAAPAVTGAGTADPGAAGELRPVAPVQRAPGMVRQDFGRTVLTSAGDLSLPFALAVLVVVHLVVGGGRGRDERLTEAPLGAGDDVVEFR